MDILKTLMVSLALRAVPQRFRLGIKALFPFLMVVEAFTNEGGEERDIHEEPIDEIGRETQRLHEIDEQHHPRLVGMVPGLVLIGIVENNDLALAPMADLVLHPDRDLVARLGHDEAEMQSEHTIVGTAVRRQVLARLED